MKHWLLSVMLMGLLGAGAAVADWSGSPAPHTPARTFGLSDAGWRRTTQGWEHESQWRVAPLVPGLRVSPLVVAVLQTLLAIGALVLFERRATSQW